MSLTPGKLVRTVLGPRLFAPIGRLYRGFFVDLEKVVDCLPPLASDATVLEIGGGDGQLMNALLGRYPGLRATMIDISATAGQAILPEFRERVVCLPNTRIADYVPSAQPDLVILSDVVHHIAPGQRPQFFAELAPLLANRSTLLAIKEVRPGSFKARLALAADHHISGERQVRFLDEAALLELVQSAIPEIQHRATNLFDRDAPNYCTLFGHHGLTS
jgi:trans-aconitate methyltransferase